MSKLNTRIQNKHDVEVNWQKAVNFIPLEGEIIIYDADGNYSSQRIKIGDGKTNVNELPFVYKTATEIESYVAEEIAKAQLEGEDVDLSAYATKLELNNGLELKVNKADMPNATKGDGEDSIVIGEGVATGDYSLASGTTDSSLINDLVGSTVGSQFTITAPEAKGDVSVAMGASTKAYSAGARAYGVSNQAGYLGYYIWSVSGKTITLSTNQHTSLTFSRSKPNSSILGQWKTGMTVSCVNGDYYPCFGKITAIDASNGTITVDSIPFTELSNGLAMAPHDTMLIAIPDVEIKSILGQEVETTRPAAIGEVEFGFGASTDGFDNIAAGIVSTATGYRNTAIDTAAFVTGRDNFGSHATLVGGLRNKALGKESLVTGRDNTTTGEQSAAVGKENTASGNLALAFGYNNTATGEAAIAEGISNTASGRGSHAEGNSSKALGTSSHAEGQGTTASGLYSHTEGNATDAYGNSSHAEGWKTHADGDYSHAEGQSTTTTGAQAHAEGLATTASGDRSHAEGRWTTAAGPQSHAEGEYTVAVSKNQHVEGRYNIRDLVKSDEYGEYLHIAGNGTSEENRSNAYTLDWDGNAWFAGEVTLGSENKKLASEEFVTDTVNGVKTYVDTKVDNIDTANADWFENDETSPAYVKNRTHWVEIYDGQLPVYHKLDKNYLPDEVAYKEDIPNIDDLATKTYVNEHYVTVGERPGGTSGKNATAEGYWVIASGEQAHAEGSLTEALGNSSHAEGYSSKAFGNRSHAEGAITNALGTGSHSEGGATAEKPSSIDANTSNADIISAWDTSKFNLAKGLYSHTEGKDTLALGEQAHAQGLATIASGDYSHAEGQKTVASGSQSHAEGIVTKASGSRSHAEGRYTIAAGNEQHVQGRFNTADISSTYAHIVGNGTSEEKRSNAHTLDWNGNAWFKGDVYVSGTKQTSATTKIKDGVWLSPKLPKLFYGTTAPTNDFGANGDIYIMIEE